MSEMKILYLLLGLSLALTRAVALNKTPAIGRLCIFGSGFFFGMASLS